MPGKGISAPNKGNDKAMLNIISLGAGVQSSTMALMAAHGEIEPMPDFAIFADTQNEPKAVYDWLEWLEKQLPFPVRRVTAGDLYLTSTETRISAKSGLSYLSHNVPAFTRNSNGSLGNWRRQCTDKHKLTPIRKALKPFLNNGIVLWVGISIDEVARMKDSVISGITHRWPLIELGISRTGCKIWMGEHDYPEPPRSACMFCPYRRDRDWREMKLKDPEGWHKAIAYEKRLQAVAWQIPRLDGVPYLHDSRVPLDQVDFSTDEDRGQLNMFQNECEGMCGV